MVHSQKAKEAGAVLTQLFKTTGLRIETQPLLERLATLYPGVLFDWDNGLRVKVPRGMQLPHAIRYFARQIDVLLEDGTCLSQKNVEPARGPSRWELIRHPKL